MLFCRNHASGGCCAPLFELIRKTARSPSAIYLPWVYTEIVLLSVQPIRRHLKENRKGPDSHLPEKRSFADFRNIANSIRGKRFHEN